LIPGVLAPGDTSPPDRALNIDRTAVTSPFVKLRLLALIALASALMLSLTVSPAGAGLGGRVALVTDCTVFASEFSAYARLLESVQAGGGSNVRREPELGRATEIGPQRGRGEGFSEDVPTWFHIVHDANGSGNVSNKAVFHQLYVLQGTFAGFEHGGESAGFNFTMAGITRTANTAWHNAGPGTADERAMKQALHAGGDNTLNVYLTSGAGYLGWAYFPGITETDPILDGVVIDWRSMLETSTQYQGQYDLGKTLPHEAGHWLNLYHTFQGGCSEPGDMIPDTPAQASPTSGCPVGRDSCPASGLDPIHNYMDYSYDECYYEFTPDQILRMQDAWIEWREN
jgi:Pregnancy-associated plasma protein-A